MPVFNTGIKQLHKIGGGLLVMKITLKTSRTFTEVRAASILISGLKKKRTVLPTCRTNTRPRNPQGNQ